MATTINQQFSKKQKVYICVDVDSFFAQCDSRKLGLDNSVPLGSVQWGSVVSANYAARAFGVKNLMSLEEAKRLCPQLVAAHADTFRVGETIFDPYQTDVSEKYKTHDKNKEKVSLEYFRAEADRIFDVLEKYSDIVEKASFDEAFLDVTAQCAEIYKKGEYKNEWRGKMCGGEPFTPQSEYQTMLMIATHMAEEIRAEIEKTLNYTTSAGISFNKMLCKLASGLNKPNGQAIICPEYVVEALKPVKIEKLRNFGRKIQAAFEEKKMTKLGEIHDLTLMEILDIVGNENTAKWVYFRARGFDDEEVVQKEFASKSIASSKTLKNIDNMVDLEVCVDLILTELHVRLVKFLANNQKLPRNLTVSYCSNNEWKWKSKTILVDLNVQKFDIPKVLKVKTMEILRSIESNLWPCSVLSVSAKNFEKADSYKFGFDLNTYFKKQSSDPQKQESLEEEKTRNINEETTDFNNTFQSSMLLDDGESVTTEKVANIPVEKVVCERCFILLEIDRLASHLDFHAAEDLDKELNPNKKKYKKLPSNEEKGSQKPTQSDGKSGKSKEEEFPLKRVKKNPTTSQPLLTQFTHGKEKTKNVATLDRFFGGKS